MSLIRFHLPISKLSVSYLVSNDCNVRRYANYQSLFVMLKSNGVGGGMCLKASTQSDDNVIVRQCANYQPPMWKDDFIQSLHNEFGGKTYKKRFNQLKGQVKDIAWRKKRLFRTTRAH
ncbi:(R)-limonene synthase 1, chloroplastic-like [Cucumis melo]|uniref:(R)-limonene synthase 1, chloroplastic-like n=1 Tax=Cucumis melo TaxID=3656 RepID=A0A1S4E303_CUCME|nr:(R)-limonene synthase 1, chloroplastic-like [Cucumis melo]